MLKILTILFLTSCGSPKDAGKREVKSIELEKGKSYKIVVTPDLIKAFLDKNIETSKNNIKNYILDFDPQNKNFKKIKEELIKSIKNDTSLTTEEKAKILKILEPVNNLEELMEKFASFLIAPLINDPNKEKDIKKKLTTFKINIRENGEISINKLNENGYEVSYYLGTLKDPLNILMDTYSKDMGYKFENGKFYQMGIGPIELIEVK